MRLSHQSIANSQELIYMHHNRFAQSQQHRIQHYAVTSGAFDFFNILTSPRVNEDTGNLVTSESLALIPANRNTLHVYRAYAEARLLVPEHRECLCRQATSLWLAAMQHLGGWYCIASQRYGDYRAKNIGWC